MKSYYGLAAAAIVLTAITVPAAPSTSRGAVQAHKRLSRPQQAVARGLDYLRKVQERDGSWSEYPATTALAAAAFLRNGRTEIKDSAVARAIAFILRSARPDGGIYSSANPATALPNYNTSLCLMALALTRNPAYKSAIAKAQGFIERSQFDESDGIKPNNPLYGGIGYGSDPDDHPDLSNLQTALEALKASGTPESAAVWKRAIVFIQRVQDRRESNDQAWVKQAPNDGGFVYDSEGDSKSAAGGHTSMGAMTYAGLKSYIYAGVSRSDPRVQAAFHWIRGNYTVTQHPGEGSVSLYYYYHTMAKTLAVYGQKIVVDTSGRPHNWSQDLANQIVSVQRPDGSWYNSNSRYWENQPPLVTSYTLIALSYCLNP